MPRRWPPRSPPRWSRPIPPMPLTYQANAKALRRQARCARHGDRRHRVTGEGQALHRLPRRLSVFRASLQCDASPARSPSARKPFQAPSASRRSTRRSRDLGATCVFAEPQFEPRLVDVVIEGTKAKSGVLDPEAATLRRRPGSLLQPHARHRRQHEELPCSA